MKTKIRPDFQQHFREGQVGMKTFYSFTREEKNKYLQSLLDLPKELRTTVDDHILRFNSMFPEQPVKHFFSIDE